MITPEEKEALEKEAKVILGTLKYFGDSLMTFQLADDNNVDNINRFFGQQLGIIGECKMEIDPVAHRAIVNFNSDDELTLKYYADSAAHGEIYNESTDKWAYWQEDEVTALASLLGADDKEDFNEGLTTALLEVVGYRLYNFTALGLIGATYKYKPVLPMTDDELTLEVAECKAHIIKVITKKLTDAV